MLALALSFLMPASAAVTPPTLASLKFSGTPEFVRAAKDVIDVRLSLLPNFAAESGLFDDAVRVPSFSDESVAKLVARLDKDLSGMRAMPWRKWSVDEQIDFRWTYAMAQEARQQLAVEKIYRHRAASWLEPLANDYIALLSYAPERADLRAELTALVPAMVKEMREVCAPTVKDVKTADGILAGLLSTLKAEAPSEKRDAAVASLETYRKDMGELKGLKDFEVIGAGAYGWRLKHALLLPWSPQDLLQIAKLELFVVDEEAAKLKSSVAAPKALPEEVELAKNLTKDSMLGMYDEIVRQNMAFLKRSELLTVPEGVGAIRARETPEAMVPLTGDGGSMNPPPPFAAGDQGWWNVQHFKADWTQDVRLSTVLDAREFRRTDEGPYAVHEGVPGHHLQLSIARLKVNPLRNLLYDNTFVEGWALYAEQMFQEAGGLGPSPEARYNTLMSYRFRIRRVFYDVRVETGEWDLQKGADFKDESVKPGSGSVDPEIQRAIQWPTQLIGYFVGKRQIVALKEDYKRKLGAKYSDRLFHDELLAVGGIPVVFARAKLLGEPVPDLD